MDHIVTNYWPTEHKAYEWEKKIKAVEKHLQDDIFKLEELEAQAPAGTKTIKPVKRRVVRKSKS